MTPVQIPVNAPRKTYIYERLADGTMENDEKPPKNRLSNTVCICDQPVSEFWTRSEWLKWKMSNWNARWSSLSITDNSSLKPPLYIHYLFWCDFSDIALQGVFSSQSCCLCYMLSTLFEQMKYKSLSLTLTFQFNSFHAACSSIYSPCECALHSVSIYFTVYFTV